MTITTSLKTAYVAGLLLLGSTGITLGYSNGIVGQPTQLWPAQATDAEGNAEFKAKFSTWNTCVVTHATVLERVYDSLTPAQKAATAKTSTTKDAAEAIVMRAFVECEPVAAALRAWIVASPSKAELTKDYNAMQQVIGDSTYAMVAGRTGPEPLH